MGTELVVSLLLVLLQMSPPFCVTAHSASLDCSGVPAAARAADVHTLQPDAVG